MSGTEMIGWTAAALMLSAFACRDPHWMRPLAVCTNLAFIGYGWSAGLAPVLALHALLLPINLLRWWQVVHPPSHRRPEGPRSHVGGAGGAGVTGVPSATRARRSASDESESENGGPTARTGLRHHAPTAP